MIEIKNITKTYQPKKGAAVQALKGINLTIEDKGMVFILGKSGSGKSTLLHILGGLDNYNSGELIIKGKSSENFKSKDFDAYRNTLVGFIFQDYNILDEFSVGNNIMLALELQGQKTNKAEVERSLKEVDLDGYFNRKPNELSGGQKQRVAIARALIKNPEIIMADEPTGALDSKTGIQVFDTLKKLSKDKLVIIVSHDRDFAELYADRIIEFADGQVISDVQKYKKAPKVATAGVSIVENKAVIIKQGHQVTVTELNYINRVISFAAQKGNAIIPLTPEANNEVKKALKIDEEGNCTTFNQTEMENLPLKAYGPNDLVLKKSRLPFKHSFKMGASALKHKKFRLFLTILLSSMAFALFGFVDTIGSYNIITSTYESIQQSNINYFSVQRYNIEKDGEYEYENESSISATELQEFKTKHPDYFITPVYANDKSNSYSSSYNFTQNLGNVQYNSYYDCSANGFTTLSQNIIQKFGFHLTGALPKAVSGNSVQEIVLTHYQFETFKKYGYKYQDENYVTHTSAINSYSDLIGKTVSFEYIVSEGTSGHWNNITCVVVGILNTNYDVSRYSSLASENVSSGIDTYMLDSEFRTLKQKSLYNTLFVHETNPLFTKNPPYINWITMPRESKNSDISLIQNVINSKTSTSKLKIETPATFLLNQMDSTLKQIANIMFYVGIGFAVFASLLLFNFITTSISYKKREIGILRAVGAKSGDVFGIFFNESFIIAFINFVLASIFSCVGCVVLNSELRSQGLLISLINFGLRQIILIFVVAIVAAFISTILPVAKIAKKKPIDAIKNR